MTTPVHRRSLPLLVDATHSNRSRLTCRFKCGDACYHEVPNTSSNQTFGEVMAQAMSRRGFLRTTAVIGAGGAVAALGGAELAAAAPSPAVPAAPRRPHAAKGLNFTAIAPQAGTDAVVTPSGYAQDVVIRWGDPMFPGAPAFDYENQSAAAQEQQWGYNNDMLAIFPYRGATDLLVCNFEYTDETIMFPGWDKASVTREQVDIALAAHGIGVVGIRSEHRRGSALRPVLSCPANRRITGTTPFELTGPAAGSALLKTYADPSGRRVLGTLNNCAGGWTPWGTYLSGEENFNQYFANADAVTDETAKARLKRYGIPTGATDRGWEKHYDRFDTTKELNETNRFGWMVEVDPYDPHSTPKKRTALGRFKHEGGQPRITRDGRVAVYMGDDERFDYLYKFVSDKRFMPGESRQARRHNMTLLDTGTLYVARFSGDSPAAEIDGDGELPADGAFDGSGVWIPLAHNKRSFVEGMTADEVYVFTRQAGDAVGATKMDRPEDVEPHPATGTVYVSLTNNTQRGTAGKAGPDEPNPRSSNKHGHVVEVRERHNDAASTKFSWGIFLLCGDPEDPSTYFAGFDKTQVSPISCPDNITFDPHGNLWISTDGNALGFNDGLFGVAVRGAFRGQVKQFLAVPVGAETCGPWVERDRVFVNVQHPGEGSDPASHWPDGGNSVPRPATVVVWQGDGLPIGRF